VLKSSRDFIAFAPHIMKVVEWCLSNLGIHLLGARSEVPKPIPNLEPPRLEPSIDFEPIDENIDLSHLMNTNIHFVESEHSRVNHPPHTGVVIHASIKGSLRGENWRAT